MSAVSVSPAEAASIARSRLGIGDDAPIGDILQLIENDGVAVFVINLPADEFAGAYQIQEDQPFILLNQDQAVVRKRFTIAHEYGHHCLRHGAVVDKTISWSTGDIKEREANAFAAAFLMPSRAVSLWAEAHEGEFDLIGVNAFAGSFGVSAQAACYRLSNLEYISTGTTRKLSESIRNGEHRRSDNSPPRPFIDSMYTEHDMGSHVPFDSQRRISSMLTRGQVSEDVAARMLRISPWMKDAKIKKLAETDDSE